MRTVLAAASAIALACSTAEAVAADASRADKAAITEIEHGLAATMNVDDLPKYYAPDIVLYDVLGNFLDMEAVRGNFIAFMKDMKSIHADFVSLTIESDGKLAVAYSIQKGIFARKDGSELRTTFRETDVLRKKHGRWLIFHSQLSMPIDVTTGKAIMNGPA
jgi:ketosteroid isomerase-like protein